MSDQSETTPTVVARDSSKTCSAQIMGILNVTPDSFSDGGRYSNAAQAIAHAREMIAEGADIIDIGGESTRPGAGRVPAAEQIRRVVDVIDGMRAFWNGPISIDTTLAAVARAAFAAGADWINDISALRDDPDMVRFVAETQCPVVLMHMQGTPATMQEEPVYDDVVADVAAFLGRQAEFAIRNGVARDRIIVDPGIGFGKTVAHNCLLLSRLDRLTDLGYPVLVGLSRKSFIGHLTGVGNDQRLQGSLIGAVAAVQKGAAIVRVHDVAATQHALTLAAAVGAFD